MARGFIGGRARGLREEAKKALREKRDPKPNAETADALPAAVTAATFKQATLAWLRDHTANLDPEYADLILRRLTRYIFPEFGDKPITQVTKAMVRAALVKAQSRGLGDTVRRLRQYVSSVFEHASDDLEGLPNPTPRTGIKPPPKAKHRVTTHGNALGKVLYAVETGDIEKITQLALKFTALTAARTIETRYADFADFESLTRTTKALWRVPAAKMKRDREHLVPLSRQACEVLEEARKITGGVGLVFPGDARDGTISDNTMLFALYRLGFHSKQTVHGLRRSFSTAMNEAGFNKDHIEKALSHEDEDETRATYNAAEYLPQRREILQAWADQLDDLTRRARVHDRAYGG